MSSNPLSSSELEIDFTQIFHRLKRSSGGRLYLAGAIFLALGVTGLIIVEFINVVAKPSAAERSAMALSDFGTRYNDDLLNGRGGRNVFAETGEATLREIERRESGWYGRNPSNPFREKYQKYPLVLIGLSAVFFLGGFCVGEVNRQPAPFKEPLLADKRQPEKAKSHECPWCAGSIVDGVFKCRHCASDIEWVNINGRVPCRPQDREDVERKESALKKELEENPCLEKDQHGKKELAQDYEAALKRVIDRRRYEREGRENIQQGIVNRDSKVIKCPACHSIIVESEFNKDSGCCLICSNTSKSRLEGERELGVKELIDEQHAEGAIPANPLAALRERLMKVVSSIKDFEAWQEEQLKELAPFRVENPKVSLEQINSMIRALPPAVSEEQDSIQQIIASCDSNYWYVKGNNIHLRSELEEIQQALLPEFSKYCDGNKGCTLKEVLGANLMGELQRLAELHAQQAAAAAEIESLLQQGNYKTARAKADTAKLLSAEGKSFDGFTDINFAKQAEGISMCDGKVKRFESEATKRTTSEVFLKEAESIAEKATGEFRDDLNNAVIMLKANIAKTKKTLKTMIIISVSGVIVMLLLVAFSVYSERKKAAEQEAEKKAIAEQLAAEQKPIAEQQLRLDSVLADAVTDEDMQAVKKIAEKVLPVEELTNMPITYTGWAKRTHDNGELSELYRFKNGKANGMAFSWRKNGNLSWKVNYQEGKKHGTEYTWGYSGKRYFKGNYKNGVKVE